jgi:uroporphyrinogen-III synthase
MEPVFTVGVTADRRSDEQALLFERLGIRTVIGSALATVMTTDDGELRAVTDALIAAPPDDLVADTGIGIRSWLEAARSWGLGDELLAALAASRILARGPKALGALRSAGLPVAWRASSEQLSEVIDHLTSGNLTGRRVALQLHGEEEASTRARLRDAGAEVIAVPVYRWAVPADQDPALRLIGQVCEGAVDAVTFTAAPAVHNLMALARGIGAGDQLLAALNGPVLVGCVGPVCAAAAREEGIADPVFPEYYRLGALVRFVAEELARRSERTG